MEKQKVVILLQRVCIIRPVCNHLIGEHHTFTHRAVVGVVVMVFGVVVAESGAHADLAIAKIAADTVGFGLHGIGLVPFVEKLLASVE